MPKPNFLRHHLNAATAFVAISLALSNSANAISKSFSIDDPYLRTGMVTFDDMVDHTRSDGSSIYLFDFVMGSNILWVEWEVSNPFSSFEYDFTTGRSVTSMLAIKSDGQNGSFYTNTQISPDLGVFKVFESLSY